VQVDERRREGGKERVYGVEKERERRQRRPRKEKETLIQAGQSLREREKGSVSLPVRFSHPGLCPRLARIVFSVFVVPFVQATRVETWDGRSIGKAEARQTTDKEGQRGLRRTQTEGDTAVPCALVIALSAEETKRTQGAAGLCSVAVHAPHPIHP